jgi:hypothetical protein
VAYATDAADAVDGKEASFALCLQKKDACAKKNSVCSASGLFEKYTYVFSSRDADLAVLRPQEQNEKLKNPQQYGFHSFL